MKFSDLPGAVVRLNPRPINVFRGQTIEALCDEWVVRNQGGLCELQHITGNPTLAVDPDQEVLFLSRHLGHSDGRPQGVLKLGMQLTVEDHKTVRVERILPPERDGDVACASST